MAAEYIDLALMSSNSPDADTKSLDTSSPSSIQKQPRQSFVDRLSALPVKLRLQVASDLYDAPTILGATNLCCTEDYLRSFDERRVVYQRIPCFYNFHNRYQRSTQYNCEPLIFLFEHASPQMTAGFQIYGIGGNLPHKGSLRRSATEPARCESLEHSRQTLGLQCWTYSEFMKVQPASDTTSPDISSLQCLSLCLEGRLEFLSDFVDMIVQAVTQQLVRPLNLERIEVSLIVRDASLATKLRPIGSNHPGNLLSVPLMIEEEYQRFTNILMIAHGQGTDAFPMLRAVSITVEDMTLPSCIPWQHTYRFTSMSGHLWHGVWTWWSPRTTFWGMAWNLLPVWCPPTAVGQRICCRIAAGKGGDGRERALDTVRGLVQRRFVLPEWMKRLQRSIW